MSSSKNFKKAERVRSSLPDQDQTSRNIRRLNTCRPGFCNNQRKWADNSPDWSTDIRKRAGSQTIFLEPSLNPYLSNAINANTMVSKTQNLRSPNVSQQIFPNPTPVLNAPEPMCDQSSSRNFSPQNQMQNMQIEFAASNQQEMTSSTSRKAALGQAAAKETLSVEQNISPAASSTASYHTATETQNNPTAKRNLSAKSVETASYHTAPEICSCEKKFAVHVNKKFL